MTICICEVKDDSQSHGPVKGERSVNKSYRIDGVMVQSPHDAFYKFLTDRGIKWYSSFVGSLED